MTVVPGAVPEPLASKQVARDAAWILLELGAGPATNSCAALPLQAAS